MFTARPPSPTPGGVFKGDWIDCPTEWTQPDLAEEFQAIRSLRALVYKSLSLARETGSLRNFTEAQVGVATDSESLYTLLRKYGDDWREGGEREGYSLADLFIVSRARVELGSDGAGVWGEGVRCEDGEVVLGGEGCGVRVGVWRAEERGRHKCPRCWLWTAETRDQLCFRCAHVHNTESHN